MVQPDQAKPLPPGLRKLCEADGLSTEQAAKLLSVAGRLRVRYPKTVDEWRSLGRVVHKYPDILFGLEEPAGAEPIQT